MKTTISPKKLILSTRHFHDLSARRRGVLIIWATVAACLGFSPLAEATCQEGCDIANTFLGDQALAANTTGASNTAVGSGALSSNAAGSGNTAAGWGALEFNTTGQLNTATGTAALEISTTGNYNTANGAGALESSTTGNNNTGAGFSALVFNTTGSNNTATGATALESNTTGSYNTATGYNALSSSTTGIYNTADGVQALRFNTTGNSNSASGINALYSNTTGGGNSALGFNSLFRNTSGSYNIAIGYSSGSNLTTGIGNIDIGNVGVAGEGLAIRIGSVQTRAFLAGVRNAVAAGGVAVYVAADGQLGTNPSSRRFKQDIADMDKQSEAILALRPVSFHYKKELDPNSVPQFGLVAEEVEKVDPALVARDQDGKPYTVRYEAVNAMLLNEFLKEHRKVQEQQAAIVQQKEDFARTTALQEEEIKALSARLDEQVTQLQKVSAQLQVERSAPRVAGNSR
jgi:hypothetical protein